MKTKIPHLILAGLFASATALPGSYHSFNGANRVETRVSYQANTTGTLATTYTDGASINPTVGSQLLSEQHRSHAHLQCVPHTTVVLVTDAERTTPVTACSYRAQVPLGSKLMFAWERWGPHPQTSSTGY